MAVSRSHDRWLSAIIAKEINDEADCSFAMLLSIPAAGPAAARKMEITSDRSRCSSNGPAANFTGAVVVTPLYAAGESTPSTGGLVKLAPGARSAWHTRERRAIPRLTRQSRRLPVTQWLIDEVRKVSGRDDMHKE